ncbi:MAG: DMT family transporter [Bacteroidales bacterium]|nr:DMT family transporter [Bacteroidales bacterium]
MQQQQSNGYFFAFGASLALASSFIFSKSVLNHLTMVQFGLFWFSMGVFWNGAWFLIRRDYRKLKGSFGKKTAVAVVIAVLEGMASGLFYMAIKEMENPAVVSFIGNIGPVFVTIMGITLLQERFRNTQLVGIIITILGVFVINFRHGGFTGFLDPGSVYVILASFLFSVATIVGRKCHSVLLPGYMSLIRSFFLAIAMAVLFVFNGQMPEISAALWRDLSIGSLLETLIVIVFAYQALKLIEATKTSLIISSKGVWTLLLAWVFLGVFPTGLQLAGGIITLVGVWLITWDRPVIRRG